MTPSISVLISAGCTTTEEFVRFDFIWFYLLLHCVTEGLEAHLISFVFLLPLMFNNDFCGFRAKPLSGCLQLFLMNIKYLPNPTKLKCSCKVFLLISQHLKHHFDCRTPVQYVAESHSISLLFWHTWVVKSAPLIPGAYLCSSSRAERVHTRRVTVEIDYTDPPVGPNFLSAGFIKPDALIPKTCYFWLSPLLFPDKVRCLVGYMLAQVLLWLSRLGWKWEAGIVKCTFWLYRQLVQTTLLRMMRSLIGRHVGKSKPSERS